MIHRIKVRTHATYYDRPDTSDRVFYIYNLARYNNRPHYHFGETSDLYFIESKLRARVPIYTKVCYYPLSDVATHSIKEFEQYIANMRVYDPPFELDNIFALDSSDDMNIVLSKVDEIFR